MRYRCALAALALFGPILFGQVNPVRIAGLDPGSTSVGDGGPALQGRLEFPISVALDAAGNLYIADDGLLRIRKVTPGGVISTIAGNGDFTSGADGAPAVSSPVWPYGVAVDSNGTVYFSDSHARVRKIAPDGTLVTVAGFIGTGPDGGDGGPATAARIAPWGIAVDRSGNIYFAESSTSRVRKVTPDGIIHTVAGVAQLGNPDPAGPPGPTRVALDGAGNLYIADSTRIFKMTAGGILTRIAGGGAARVDEVPATSSYVSAYGGISVDPAGNVYSADWYGNVIRKISTDGIIHTIAGSGKQGATDGCGSALAAQFYAPEDVVADPAGNVYTGERGNPRVRLISAAGSIRTVAGPGPSPFSGDNGPATSAAVAPAGLAFDQAGNLYVADQANNRVREITTDGIIMTIAGADAPVAGDYSGCVLPPGTLSHPAAVATDAHSTLYIADTGNHRVMSLPQGGTLSVVAGTGAAGFSGDGASATAAMLNAPAGIAVDAAGNLYIADTGNNRLRIVGPDGDIRTAVASLPSPMGLALDSAGSLYIAESTAHRVVRMTPDGTLEPFAGTGFYSAPDAPIAHDPFELGSPVAVAADPFNSIYIADQIGKLQRITPNCAVADPVFGTISGVAADPQGNVYFSASGVVWKLPAFSPAPGETATPRLAYSAFVNAASLLTAIGTFFTGPLTPFNLTYGAAPGEMVRIRGVCLGPFDAVKFDPSGPAPTTLAGASVLFDQTPAPLVSVQAGEIWAIAPSSIAGQSSSKVTVRFNGGTLQTTAVVLPAEPGIFTSDGSGSGQALALNIDNSINSPANPAERGSILVFWATGQGATDPPVGDGQPAPVNPLSRPVLPVSVTIDGQTAEVLDAALSPGLVGALQVNVRIPAQIPPGSASLTLSVGGITRNQPPANVYDGRQSVTIAVK